MTLFVNARQRGRAGCLLLAGLVTLLLATPAPAEVIISDYVSTSTYSSSLQGYTFNGGPNDNSDYSAKNLYAYGENLSSGSSVTSSGNYGSGSASASASVSYDPSTGVLELKGNGASLATGTGGIPNYYTWNADSYSSSESFASFTITNPTMVHLDVDLKGDASVRGSTTSYTESTANLWEELFTYAPGFVLLSLQSTTSFARDDYGNITSFGPGSSSFNGDILLQPGTYFFYGSLYGETGMIGDGTASQSSSFDVKITFLSVPEPATLAVVGLGLLGYAGFGWRRRRQTVEA